MIVGEKKPCLLVPTSVFIVVDATTSSVESSITITEEEEDDDDDDDDDDDMETEPPLDAIRSAGELIDCHECPYEQHKQTKRWNYQSQNKEHHKSTREGELQNKTSHADAPPRKLLVQQSVVRKEKEKREKRNLWKEI